MARIRSIKPEFCSSTDTGAVSREARLFFLQLLTEVDDAGRVLWIPRRLAGVLYPHDEDVDGSLLERWAAECETRDMVRVYTIDGVRYLQVTNFQKHQVINRPTPSKLPAPPVHVTEPSGSTHAVISEGSLAERNREGNREGNREEEGECEGSGAADASPGADAPPPAEPAEPPLVLDPPSPDPRRGGEPQPRKRRDEITYGAWVDACTAAKEPLLRNDDPIFEYATASGIPREFIALAWSEFDAKFVDSLKRQRDWRAHFRDHIRRGWMRLWYFDAAGECRLNATGVQAQRALKAAA